MAATRAAAASAADSRRQVRAALWEARAAASLSRQMGLVNALSDASAGWITRERLGDAVERLVDEAYMEMDEAVPDPPINLIPAGFLGGRGGEVAGGGDRRARVRVGTGIPRGAEGGGRG